MKFCKDCKHCGPNLSYKNRETCNSPHYVNLITGENMTVECRYARQIKFLGLPSLEEYGYETCGPDAQYFEAKK